MTYKMKCMESLFSALTFSFCNAFTNKLLAIIFSCIKFGLYLTIYKLLQKWEQDTKKLEAFCIFQFSFEILILITSILMLIFSRYLNINYIFYCFRTLTIIITVYLFFGLFNDIYMLASIKFKAFPDMFRLDDDPLFDYYEGTFYSLNDFINKETNKINSSSINDEIFQYTHLEKNGSQIYVSDPKYFKINFTVELTGDMTPYKIQHRFEFNKEMILQLINLVFGFFSFFLWNSIRFKHKKLIQNGMVKKFGKKIMYCSYGFYLFFMIPINTDQIREKAELEEIRKSLDFISPSDISSCCSCMGAILELIFFLGSLIVFIILMVLRGKQSFAKKAKHFPFVLTNFGQNLYLFLLIFMIVSFGIYLFLLSKADLYINHYENKDSIIKKRCGCFTIFTFGIVYLFFSICGIVGTMFFIAGNTDSNGNLYIKTACINSDISCYGLFNFGPLFEENNQKYHSINYYIFIKEITNSDKAKNMASLITILLIYFCQFYYILFEEILVFNFDDIRFGKCVIEDYIIGDNSCLFLAENMEIDDTNKYYRNHFNDNYFNKIENNSGNNNQLPQNKMAGLNHYDVNIIQYTSTLRNINSGK